jgi:CRP-like cAMP-binding protein
MPGNPLILRLSRLMPLSAREVGALVALCAREERFRAGSDIAIKGRAPRPGFVVTHGMAWRYRLLSGGRRQILTVLIPGDFFDLYGFLLEAMDHSVAAVGPTRIAVIERQAVTRIVAAHPRLAAALWWSALQEQAMLRERIVALGRRDASGRLAYFLCEIMWRMQAIGLCEDNGVRLPFTQTDLADALGLTPVHVNRILQRFRRDGLITLDHRRLVLRDLGRLQAIAELTPDYLHLGRAPPEALRHAHRERKPGR